VPHKLFDRFFEFTMGNLHQKWVGISNLQPYWFRIKDSLQKAFMDFSIYPTNSSIDFGEIQCETFTLIWISLFCCFVCPFREIKKWYFFPTQNSLFKMLYEVLQLLAE
jgi:hypothetical protein